MTFDWTISIWQVLTVIWLTFIFFFVLVRKVDKLMLILEDYPPHKHVRGIGEPIYPKGMRPNGD